MREPDFAGAWVENESVSFVKPLERSFDFARSYAECLSEFVRARRETALHDRRQDMLMHTAIHEFGG